MSSKGWVMRKREQFEQFASLSLVDEDAKKCVDADEEHPKEDQSRSEMEIKPSFNLDYHQVIKF